jgi:anti-sigma regulatory factor (Ser/Thr protein kinase)
MDIRAKIKEFLKDKKRVSSIEIARHFSFTRQYASQILRIMVNAGEVVKFGSTRAAFYTLPEFIDEVGPSAIRRRLGNQNIKEHEVFNDLVSAFPVFRTAPENVRSIVHYAFSEMLNNAIEHSKSKNIEVKMESDGGIIRFVVSDFGIGVFRNVMQQRHLKSELEAMQDLLKGKVTTDPKAHTGEGIFFTSKAADRFVLESFGYRMIIDNIIPDVFFQEEKRINRGTRVIFTISRNSARHLNEIFEKYQSKPGSYAFDKTEIHIRLFTMGTVYISRSQARRVLVGLEKFKKIILDFDRVPNVGQAFADEIFRVFQGRHPEISIEPANMNETVRFMVERVEKQNQQK